MSTHSSHSASTASNFAVEEFKGVSEPDASANNENLKRRYLLRRFWRLAAGFWALRGDRSAWMLTISLVVLVLLGTAAQYGVNVWNRSIFDALEQHNGSSALWLSMIFLPLVVVSVSLGVANVFVRMSIQRRWRVWMTHKVLDFWLEGARYYHLKLIEGDHKNPEARMTDDLRTSTDAPVDFATGVFSAIISAITFIAVLWTIGGTLNLALGTTTLVIPGFLVIAAVSYAGVATLAMLFIAKRFVPVSEQVNQVEAEFRYGLTRVYENGESIALLGGEDEERSGVNRSLSDVAKAWIALCGQHMRSTIVSQSSGLLAPVVPVILCAPKYLAGEMSLGQVMQAASAFTIVQGSFNWLVDNYPRLASWNASARRVASLIVSLDLLKKAEGGDGINRIERGAIEGVALSLKGLSVALNDGTVVVDDTEVNIEKGERVLVAGESGTGKSTLVRAISGLWPWGEGKISVQQDARLFLLPQRPYIPTGTLRRAIAYPGAADDWDDAEIASVLEKVGLTYLQEQLDQDQPWDQSLSGGEKQRLAFARLLLHRPDIAVLDEATSALDEKSQRDMMAILVKELEKMTIVSVGHRSELEEFHTRKLTFARRSEGARLVDDEELEFARQQRRLPWLDFFRTRGSPSRP